MRGGEILRSKIDIPWESLEPGPKGSRVHVIDYDTTTGYLVKSEDLQWDDDPMLSISDKELLDNPQYHSLNVYVITMSILARFESALGRRVEWAFEDPQLKIAPHAFADANAYYSKDNQALLFGYIPERKPIFTCLSFDIVAHETSHALVDALRPNYMRPSSADPIAFHEGFADIVALLSVLSQQSIIEHALTVQRDKGRGTPSLRARLIPEENLTEEALKDSILFGVAEEFGKSMNKARGDVLRRSIKLKPSVEYLDAPEYQEPHHRGEILVSAVMNAYLEMWLERIKPLKEGRKLVDRERVVEEGVGAAQHLCTMVIRALDYVPPIDLKFQEYLVGLLTADSELYPDDRYNYREVIERCFAAFGMGLSCHAIDSTLLDGLQWRKSEDRFCYDNVHFDALQTDKSEAWRFIWDNRKELFYHKQSNSFPHTAVVSVRPLVRLNVDGFTVRETIIEYIQRIELRTNELPTIGINKPESLVNYKRPFPVRLKGGGLIILNEYGRVKFHIRSDIRDNEKQEEMLAYGWRQAGGDPQKMMTLERAAVRFSSLHLNKMTM